MDTSERPWVLTSVSLIIKGRDLRPEYITPIMGIEPTATRNPGPGKWDRPGEFDGRWRISCDEHITRLFDAQLDFVLRIAEQKKAPLRHLAEQGYDVFIRVYGFAGNDASLLLPPDTVKRIALLGLPFRVAANMNER